MNTVRRVDAEPAITSATDPVQTGRPRVGRPSNTESYREFVTNLLAAEPRLSTSEVLRRTRLYGYDGQKSALYGLVRGIRANVGVPFALDTVPSGELSLHDSREALVRFTSGHSLRLHIFVTRLAYSRWLEVSLLRELTPETVCRALSSHFGRIGGVPMLSVFNHTKGIVIGMTEDGRPELDPIFGTFMLDLGVGVELKPSRLGLAHEVGNLVGSVKRSFIAGRRAVDESDLRGQLEEWLTQANARTRSQRTGLTPREALAVDRSRLRPYALNPASVGLRRPVVVAPGGFVTFEGWHYPLPREAAGTAGVIHIYPRSVTIVAGPFRATFARGQE